MKMNIYLFCLLILLKNQEIESHGRLLDPPSRSSCWREFPNNCVVEYTDNQQYCGGVSVQWEKNKGKCGICGDEWSGKRLYELGGERYPNFTVRTYEAGQLIDVKVELTANQKGWFEFRLCDADDLYNKGLDADHNCLNKHLLKDLNDKTRFLIDPNEFNFKFKLVLPPDVTCKQCVFQWKYHSGNRYGIDPLTGQGGRGLGNQEEFYGCSDVTILSSSNTQTNEIDQSTTTIEPIVTQELTTQDFFTEKISTYKITTQKSPSSTLSKNVCKKDGYFPDLSKGCTEYFICQNSNTNNVKVTQVKCPNGLLFNKDLNICDWPSITKCF